MFISKTQKTDGHLNAFGHRSVFSLVYERYKILLQIGINIIQCGKGLDCIFMAVV